MSLFSDGAMLGRFALGLPRFLRDEFSGEDCRRIIQQGHRDRTGRFLSLLRGAVFQNPRSPYLKLLNWAGIEFQDIEKMVEADGLQATLESLLEAGVYVKLDEFKGKRPVVRGTLEFGVSAPHFDNPLLRGDFEIESGGSSGNPRRMPIDFDLLRYDAAYTWSFNHAQQLLDVPHAIWRPVPPGVSGLKHALLAVKLGTPLEHWFSSNRLSWSSSMFKSALFTVLSLVASRAVGRPVARPRYVPLEDAGPIVEWLGDTLRRNNPGTLSLPANSAVRVCLAARDRGVEIAGTVFQVSGEPLTRHKWEILDSLGVRTSSSWAMAEAGRLANGCANREAIDEVHVLTDKVALVERAAPAQLARDSNSRSLFLTTLLPATTKVMLNVDTGDCGVVSRRECGCPMQALGYGLHLHTIRNYEKLTAGGMHLTGSDVLELIDRVLPAAHGGAPTDYQLVEQQGEALTRIAIVVSPRVGAVEHSRVVGTVLEFLSGRQRGDRMMADHWREGDTLVVLRREPYATGAGKVPPIRVERAGADSDRPGS